MEIPFFNSLRFKISFSYIILVSISIFITIWAISNFYRLGDSVDKIIRENYLNVVAAENMVSSLELKDNALVALISNQNKKYEDVFIQTKFDFFQWVQKNKERVTKQQQKDILDTIQILHMMYEGLADTLLMFIFDPQLREIAKTYHFNQIRPINAQLKNYGFRLIELNQKEMIELGVRTRKISNEATYAVLVASLIAVALSIFAGFRFTKSIVEPAERLTETVRNIGRGKLDLKTDIITNDEFGELSREFNKMTERLRKYDALNIEKILEEKQKAETIVENISDGIIVCNRENKIILMNDAARQLLNIEYSTAEKNYMDIIKDERVRNILSNPKSDDYISQPYLLFKKNETELYIRPRISEIPLVSGGILGTVLILQDVSQFKKLDKMKSEFMATVSHEFRTPLTSINMSIDILNEGIVGKLNSEQAELMQAAKHDAERLTKLVRELLELSRLESGRLQLRQELISINEVIKDSIKPVQLPFKEKSVELKLNLQNDLPKIIGDAQQFSWVVSNLINNALRYTPPGGYVQVRSSREENNIVVQIVDTGRGISDENIGKIFDKFVQVKESMESTPGSVGLGLAIAKEIVEIYGGKIWVESEIEKGSIFTFTIPLEQLEKI